MKEIIQKLKDRNYRITKSRTLLIELFYNNSSKHFTIDELIDSLNKKGEKINIMSLYNNLKILLNEKIIQESILNGKKVYEFINSEYHIHFYCKNCNKHIDIKFNKLKTYNEQLEKKYEFKIEHTKIEYSGICKQCLQKG